MAPQQDPQPVQRIAKGRFIFRAVLPSVLSIALFAGAVGWIVLPALERSILQQKRTMIRELTESAWNILASFHEEERRGALTREQAQSQAVSQIRNLTYGQSHKDYFWINDYHPRMVAHPYRTDLEGKDLSEVRDPNGKAFFVEFARLVQEHGAGYVRYHWQYQDDPTRVVPKLSYVKGFSPWEWVLGTGVYVDDVEREIASVKNKLIYATGGVLAVISILLFFMIRQSYYAEKGQLKAQAALRASEEKYRTLVESAGESIIMLLEGAPPFANHQMLTRLGYTREEFEHLTVDQFLLPAEDEDAEKRFFEQVMKGEKKGARYETRIRQKEGKTSPVMISLSRVAMPNAGGVIMIASDLTPAQRRQRRREQLEEDVRASLLWSGQEQSETPTGKNPETLWRALEDASTPEHVARANADIHTMLTLLVESGAQVETVTNLITRAADRCLHKLIDFAEAELGAPPAPYAFLVMGSEGRHEQTLCTDQDNALLFADVDETKVASCKAYFLDLGTRVCNGMHAAGYTNCQAKIMANNPEWVMSLGEWKASFSKWIRTSDPKDLLNSKIFFDFRAGCGDDSLCDALRDHLAAALKDEPRFFFMLARNILLFEPPLNLLRQFVLEHETPDGRAFDIKGLVAQIADFARLHALKHDIRETNTLRRLHALKEGDLLSSENHQEIVEAYLCLMRFRLENQARAIREGREPNNLLTPKRLTAIEQKMLAETMAQIKHFQSGLSYEFTGTMIQS